jgi:hypothetical protein
MNIQLWGVTEHYIAATKVGDQDALEQRALWFGAYALAEELYYWRKGCLWF